jgi:hypothetical protein
LGSPHSFERRIPSFYMSTASRRQSLTTRVQISTCCWSRGHRQRRAALTAAICRRQARALERQEVTIHRAIGVALDLRERKFARAPLGLLKDRALQSRGLRMPLTLQRESPSSFRGNRWPQFQLLGPDPGSTHRSRVRFAPMSVERGAKAIDQSRSGEGFGQEASCSRLQRSGAVHLIRKGRDENERHAITLGAHHRLQLQAAHTWHLYIRNHARRVIQAGRLQEVLGRRKYLNRVPMRPQQFASRRANRRIIVDDGNN